MLFIHYLFCTHSIYEYYIYNAVDVIDLNFCSLRSCKRQLTAPQPQHKRIWETSHPAEPNFVVGRTYRNYNYIIPQLD